MGEATMKKYLCFSITVLMILLFSVNVLAEESVETKENIENIENIANEESKYTPSSFREAGNGYFEFYHDGTWKNEDDSHTCDQEENMRTIIIGATYATPDSDSKIYKAWEFGYGWEEKGSETGNTAKFVSLDIKRALNIVDLGLITTNLTLNLHDRYYRDKPYKNYVGLLGGGYVRCNLGLVNIEGSVGYSLYAVDKSGDKVDIYTYNAKAYSPIFSGLIAFTLGYRYSSYENDAGSRHINSGVTLGLTSAW
jgi:hypothetical protein